MLHIKSIDEGRNVFKALGSDIRIDIVKVLLNENGLSMNELAERLKITNGALTSHIKKLEEAGIVRVSSDSSGHGNQKVCSVHLDKILFELQEKPQNENVYTSDIKVGFFSDYIRQIVYQFHLIIMFLPVLRQPSDGFKLHKAVCGIYSFSCGGFFSLNYIVGEIKYIQK